MKPTQEDLKILFDGNYEKYLKKYRNHILEILSESDIEEIKEMDEPERTISVFEFIFAIPFEKEDDYGEVIAILAEEFLPYEVEADYEEDDSLYVIIDDEKHSFAGMKEYDIIRKFNDLISPKHEIRVLKISLGDEDEVHTLLILKTSEWKALEEKYGEKVEEIFVKTNEINFN